MKYICLHIFLLVSFTCFSQVGIGTKNPEEALHIAGTDATIRLEGLSSVNNASNDGVDLIPTLVDTDGTVLLNPLGAGSPHNYITDASTVFASTVTVVANLGTSSTTSNIYNYNVTLTTRSFLEIKYGLAFLINETTGVKILDGKSRQIKNYFTIDGGNDIYGQYSQNYFNVDTDGGNAGFYNRGMTYVQLDPGTYTINFWANIGQGLNSSTEVVFGGDNSS